MVRNIEVVVLRTGIALDASGKSGCCGMEWLVVDCEYYEGMYRHTIVHRLYMFSVVCCRHCLQPWRPISVYTVLCWFDRRCAEHQWFFFILDFVTQGILGDGMYGAKRYLPLLRCGHT